MDASENKPLSNLNNLRTMSRTGLPLPKAGLNEMTESQSNSRTGLPVPSLKHKITDIPEPPTKQRKMEPASALRKPVVTHTANESRATTNPTHSRTMSRPNNGTQSRLGSSVSRANPPGHSYARPASVQSHYSSSGYGHSRAKSQSVISKQLAQSEMPPPRQNDWNGTAIENRLAAMEGLYEVMKSQMEGTTFERSSMKELMEQMRARILELESLKERYEGTVASLRAENEEFKIKTTEIRFETEQLKRDYDSDMSEVTRKHRHELEDLHEEHRREMDKLRRIAHDDEEAAQRDAQKQIENLRRNHLEELAALEASHEKELEEEKKLREREVGELTRQRDQQIETIATTIGKKEREAEVIREELNQKAAEIEREKLARMTLDKRVEQMTAECLTLESSNRAMKAKIDFLESDHQQQSTAFADLHRETQEAIAAKDDALAKLRAEETLRRKLHNEIQELKGNIRVFCRVRPVLPVDAEEPAKINFPDEGNDSKELIVMGQESKSSLGTVNTPQYSFSFDRVFGPKTTNSEIFDEVTQLIQSALDGYNCCIFSYGQTGTGKSYLMSSSDGMIPRAVEQIYNSAKALEEKGWTYTMHGSFVEVYNENLNDLLGRAEDIDKKKHEIRHDTQSQKTTITGVNVVPLDTPETVHDVLSRADKNRSVAATKANMRSSRSHSVFILSLAGENSITGERSEGTLNLVDLAGSERLAHSQAEGQRLKETQNINKSLSCLGDVIASLGNDKAGHIPYRNSKLTYLLQYSLGGNSKTLMIVMVSPLQPHLNESLTSLKFATKVHNTHIGTAKRQVRMKD